MDGHNVGGEVDAYCTRCKMILGHTIVAMVGDKIARVRCNTCMGEHAFRASPPGTRTPKTSAAKTGRPRPAAPKEKAEARPFETLFEGIDVSKARRYSPKERFVEREVIQHPTFGVGLVEGVREDKIDAVFKVGHKTLAHGLGAPPAREKTPRREERSPAHAADKPPPGEPHGLHAVHTEPLTELPRHDEARGED